MMKWLSYLCYVNDILFKGNNEIEMGWVKIQLKHVSKMICLGNMKYLLDV